MAEEHSEKPHTGQVEGMGERFRWQAYRLPFTVGDNIGWGPTENDAIEDLKNIEAGINVGPRPSMVPTR